MEYYKGIFVVAFVWLSLVSRLAEGERFVFKHDVDAETKAEIRGRKRAGGSEEDLRPSLSAPKWAILREFGLTADQSDIFRTAVYTTNSGEYYGSKAKINLWDLPDVVNNQISASVIRLSNLDGENVNSIQAGFHMYPEEYKDSKLHFYTSWTLDGYNSTGCFNLICGFVLVNSGILTPGDVVEPVSVYNGSQYFITISIKKEPKSGNWSVYREDLDKPQLIGYWPKTLFTGLAEKATVVSWGGIVSYSKGGTGPPMGSGHYSSELEGKAAFVKNIEIFDSNGGSIDLANIVKADVNREDCYNVTALVDSRKYGLQDGYLFYFGGPSGCSN